jgi:regulator of extracellular matrix RemA (YlzA/DUF370 family)
MLVHIGHESYLEAGAVVAILPPDSSPVRRLRRNAAERNLLVSATRGKRTRSVIVAASGHVILCSFSPETVRSRIEEARKKASLAELISPFSAAWPLANNPQG